MEQKPMVWSEVILAAREAGLTQTAIFQQAHVSETLVSDLSRGRTLQPAWNTGERILNVIRGHLTPTALKKLRVPPR